MDTPLLNELLNPHLEELEITRKELIARGNKNKTYFLLFLLVILAYTYLELSGYATIENEVIINLIFCIIAIGVLFIYIKTPPLTLIPDTAIMSFNKKVKLDIFWKSIHFLCPSAIYRPLYKTNKAYLTESGMFKNGFVVHKEDDGVIMNFNKIHICISDIQIYTGSKKSFIGLFLKMNHTQNKQFDWKPLQKQVNESLDNLEKQLKSPILSSMNNGSCYIGINLMREFCEIKPSINTPIKFELIEKDLNTLTLLLATLENLSEKHALQPHPFE